MSLQKPASIAENPFKSAKWDELTQGREFQPSDAPVIALLCQWYEVVAKCEEELYASGELRVSFKNNMGDIKPLPQLKTIKDASAEIRAINKQLGIRDEVSQSEQKPKETKIYAIQTKRRAKAENSARTA